MWLTTVLKFASSLFQVRLKIYVYRDMDPEITQGTEESKKEEFANLVHISLIFGAISSS